MKYTYCRKYGTHFLCRCRKVYSCFTAVWWIPYAMRFLGLWNCRLFSISVCVEDMIPCFCECFRLFLSYSHTHTHMEICSYFLYIIRNAIKSIFAITTQWTHCRHCTEHSVAIESIQTKVNPKCVFWPKVRELPESERKENERKKKRTSHEYALWTFFKLEP